MKNIFLLLVLSMGTLPIFSQQSFTDSLRTATGREEQKRWNLFYNEIGFNVGNLLLGGGESSTTLIYKRRYESGKLIRVRRTQARRFILSLDIDKPLKDEVPDGWFNNYLQENKISAYAAVGKELQHNLGRFQLIYGLDLYAKYRKNVYLNRNYYVDPTSETIYTRDFSQYYYEIGGGVTGFAGVRYFVHPRVSLAIETGLAVGYAHKETIQRLQEPGIDIDYSTKTHNIQTLAMAKRFFTLNFHF